MSRKPTINRAKLEAVYLSAGADLINDYLDDVVNDDYPYSAQMQAALLSTIADVKNNLQRLSDWLAQVETTP